MNERTLSTTDIFLLTDALLFLIERQEEMEPELLLRAQTLLNIFESLVSDIPSLPVEEKTWALTPRS